MKKKSKKTEAEREPEASANPVLIAWHPDFSAGRHLQVNITSALPGPIPHAEMSVLAAAELVPSVQGAGGGPIPISGQFSCGLMGGGCSHGSEIPTAADAASRRHLICQLPRGFRLTSHDAERPGSEFFGFPGTWCVTFHVDHAGSKSESFLWFRWGNEFDPKLCAVEGPD